jgi:hypothetical protein
VRPRLRTSCGSPFELCAGLSTYVHACMYAHVRMHERCASRRRTTGSFTI